MLITLCWAARSDRTWPEHSRASRPAGALAGSALDGSAIGQKRAPMRFSENANAFNDRQRFPKPKVASSSLAGTASEINRLDKKLQTGARCLF